MLQPEIRTQPCGCGASINGIDTWSKMATLDVVVKSRQFANSQELQILILDFLVIPEYYNKNVIYIVHLNIILLAVARGLARTDALAFPRP